VPQGELRTGAVIQVETNKTIWDYHMSRPNQGNGGFAPKEAHHIGRAKLMKCIFPRAWNFSCWSENGLGLLGRRAPRIQDLRFAQTVMLIAYYGFWRQSRDRRRIREGVGIDLASGMSGEL
jgi:hypothetical protein